jgi:nitrate/TMAO reductase-like tetraheme cytochrome c subunit
LIYNNSPFGRTFGTIDTREEFHDKRIELESREWVRLRANDSLECRNCHDFDSMDFTRHSKRAAHQHSTALASGQKICIDCHQGIAHRLPGMSVREAALRWESAGSDQVISTRTAPACSASPVSRTVPDS